jgi:nucleoside-diphosphate-sugar epimerase
MRVLVLGGTGSIDGPVVRELVRGGHEVVALERSGPGESYIAAATVGMPVGRIARAFARRFATRRPDPEIICEAKSPPNSVTGPGATRSTSGSAAPRRGAA